MSSRQSRKRTPKSRDTPSPSDEDRRPLAMNGNGNGSARHAPDASESAQEENIFLFWPNIIGMLY